MFDYNETNCANDEQMTEAIGLDIVENARIERLFTKHPARFVERILGPEEREIFSGRGDKIAFLSGRFAAKEALIKALGAYLTDRPPYASMQILNDPSGRPFVQLDEGLTEELSHTRILISLSHERTYAVGMAVITEKR
jgi:holo-[acyl-carrier protein] synthase